MLTCKQWKKKVLRCSVAALMALGVGSVNAEMAWLNDVKVIRTLSDAGGYGDCMIYVSKPLSDVIGNCPGRWVTFSCNGTYNGKDAGQRKFESAQLAMALGYRVSLFVDNTKKHNGYCYARRIDIYK